MQKTFYFLGKIIKLLFQTLLFCECGVDCLICDGDDVLPHETSVFKTINLYQIENILKG